MTQTNTPTTKSRKIPMMLAVVIAGVIGLMLFFRPAGHKQLVQDDEPKTYEKVVYDVASWQRSPMLTSADKADKFTKAQTLIGTTATKEETLDFNGAKADKYSYASAHEPPLYVIESKEVFELAWYYPYANDSDEIKRTAIRHAQKAHAFATALWGDDGKIIMEKMLSEQTVDDKLLKSHQLLKAQCANYTCQIIAQK